MRITRTILISVGAIVVSAIAIQASDVVRNIDGNLAGLVIDSENQSVCGPGAVLLSFAGGQLCVDTFEASPAPECPLSRIVNTTQTTENLSSSACKAASEADVYPWTFVSFHEAQQLCARSGKRLPTAGEWFDIAVALADQTSCVVDASSPQLTGNSSCVTAAGVADIVGNVWEWVDAEVVNGQYGERALPESGYVAAVDVDGIVMETIATRNTDYGDDYAITSLDGTYGIIRGGFFDSGTDAGLYAQNLAVPLSLKTPGIGFRCVRSL